MVRPATIAIGLILSFTPAIFAQEAPTRSYTSIIDENGEIQIVPSTDSTTVEVFDKRPPEDDEGAVRHFESFSAEAMALMESQDWYAGYSTEGELNALYTLPRGESLGWDVLSGKEVGEGIQKIEPAIFGLTNLFPDDDELIRQLDQFVTTAVRGFCGFEARPTEFESEVDISPGWGAAGKIKFKGKWVSSDVCDTIQ